MTENTKLLNEGRHHHKLTELAMQSTFEVIETLKSQNIITPEDIAQLQKAQAFMVSTYTDVESYRPLMVKLSGVLTDAKFPTADSKFWQCKCEAEVHMNELTNCLFKLERCKVDMEEMDYKIQILEKSIGAEVMEADGRDVIMLGFECQRLKIARGQYEFNMKLIEKDVKYRIREITDWSNIAKTLEEKCEFSTKNFQDHFTVNHKLYLEHMVKVTVDAKDKKVFAEQLDTLNRVRGA